MQASDLLSFVPSAPEPFGRTLIEAMAAGLPVIGAGSGAIPDIVVDDVTGLLIPPGDALAQADAMAVLLRDPALSAAMGQAGRQRAADHFSISAQITHLVRLYDSL